MDKLEITHIFSSKYLIPPFCGIFAPYSYQKEKHPFFRSSRAQAHATLGREFPTSTLSLMERGPNSTIAHVSCTPSKIPYVGFSPIRLQVWIQMLPSPQGLQVKSSPDIPCYLMTYTHPQIILLPPAFISLS